ncbi:MAG: aminopeptidase [Theionarchaea archaeon]|nr:aminopeptidase [Theionarchaea archaeon]
MKEIARFIADTCLDLKSEETLLIVCDYSYIEMAREFAESLDCTLVSIPPLKYNGEEPPFQVSHFIQEFDAILALTTLSLGPTDARKKACDKGVRFVSLAGITEKSLSTIMETDYLLLEERASKIGDILEQAQSIEVYTGAHVLKMSVKGRHPLSLTGIYTERGAFGTLPEGEVLISPVEESVCGSFVIDVGMVGLGFFDQPVTCHVENGHIVSVEEETDALKSILEKYEGSCQIAEVALGINPAAHFYTVFEAKKVEGTCHISLGDNHTIGGVHRCGIHMDGVISSPTVVVDGSTLVEHGVLVIP